LIGLDRGEVKPKKIVLRQHSSCERQPERSKGVFLQGRTKRGGVRNAGSGG